MNKFFNKKTGVDGILFDSAREAARYKILKEMQKKGEITGLELQPKYELLPSFRYRGQSVRKVVYIADFAYTTKDGQKVVEDVKGYMTKDYKIKKKLFLLKLVATGEDIIFKEIFREEETKHADTSDEA